MALTIVASAAADYAQAPGSGALVGAVEWIHALLLGSVATVVAVIAVASIGFLMLAGRIDIRRGAIVIGGCFVLFGATSIAAGLQSLASSGVAPADYPSIPPQAAAPPPTPPSDEGAYDPYAGAAVPTR
ncbi:MAG TPA: TrbC/VirB2 family protein [Allosphingosinicella sp.]